MREGREQAKHLSSDVASQLGQLSSDARKEVQSLAMAWRVPVVGIPWPWPDCPPGSSLFSG